MYLMTMMHETREQCDGEHEASAGMQGEKKWGSASNWARWVLRGHTMTGRVSTGDLHGAPAMARFSSTLRTKNELVSKKRSTQLARQLCSFPEKPDEIEPTHLDGERGAEMGIETEPEGAVRRRTCPSRGW